MASAPRIQFVVTNVDYKRRDPVFWIEVQVKKKKKYTTKKKKKFSQDSIPKKKYVFRRISQNTNKNKNDFQDIIAS